MNPAALKANLGDLPKGATIIVDTHDFTTRNLTKVGLRRQPARGRLAGRVRRPRRRPHRHDRRGVKESFGLTRKDAAAPRTCSRSGCCPGCTAARRGHGPVPRSEVREQARHRGRQRRGVPRRLELRRDHRDVRGLLRDQAGAAAGRHLPQHHRQPRPVLRADRRRRAVRAAAVPRLLPDHAGLRHPPRAEQAQGVRRHDLPGRGRDRRHRRRPRRVVRRRAGRHHHLRPRHRAEVGDHRPRGDDRAAPAGHRRPARRPVDRPADQDRAGRPAAGDVRPQRRVAGADRRAAVPGRLLRRGPRGRPDRGRPTARR